MTWTPLPRRSPTSKSAAGAIELCFRWIKRTLRITHFLSASENAVRIQLVVALIAHMPLRMAQTTQKAIASPIAFARLGRANLMHRRRLDRLLTSNPILPNTAQLMLRWN